MNIKFHKLNKKTDPIINNFSAHIRNMNIVGLISFLNTSTYRNPYQIKLNNCLKILSIHIELTQIKTKSSGEITFYMFYNIEFITFNMSKTALYLITLDNIKLPKCVKTKIKF
jgi:hypothetical protein